MIVNASGGGAGLNFKIVGGTTQHSNPKENTIWVNTSTAVTSWDFGAAEPFRRSKNKNLLVYPYDGQTGAISGVQWTVKGDGTLVANGTATGTDSSRSQFVLSRRNGVSPYTLSLPAGTYHLSGASGNVYLQVGVTYDRAATTAFYADDKGGGVTFTLTAEAYVSVTANVLGGKNVSNVVIKPQLEKGTAATSFVKGDATGQVWIQTGLSSETSFNALKKNGITVCPIEAKQYSGGAWVERTAQSYQGGAWVEWWQGELYKSGRQYERLTGGWKIVNASAGVGALKNDHIYLGYSGNSGRDAAAYTNNKIDFSGYKTLKAEVNILNLGDTYYGFYLGVSNNKTSGNFEGFAAYTKSRTLGRTTVSFDLSSYQGLYYAALNSSVANAEVYKVWME